MGKRDRERRVERGVFSTPNPRLPRPVSVANLLSEIEDRRQFHPEQDYRPVRSFSRKAYSEVHDANVNVQRPKAFSYRSPFGRSNLFSPTRLKFAAPKKLPLCVRRQQRREVLFAMKRTKKGAGSRKHRNYQSEVHCK